MITYRHNSLQKFESSWKFKTLKNGVRVIHVPMYNDERCYFGVSFKTGSRNDHPEYLGTAHFLEHMMFRGTQGYPSFFQFANAFEWLGGEWNAETGHEHTEYSFNGSSRVLPKVIDFFSELINKPIFLNFEDERKVILREIEDELNEFGLSTDIDWHMAQLMWPESNIAAPITGTAETVKKITLTHLKEYRDKYYTPDNMVISIVGGTDSKNIFSEIDKRFSNTPLARKKESQAFPLTTQTKPNYKLIKNTDNQYHIQLSFRAEKDGSPKSFQYEILSRILTDGFCSRLPNRLREELGLIYDIDSDYGQFKEAGSFDINVSVTLDKLEQLLKETCLILKSLKKSGPDQDELNKAKHRATIDLSLLQTDPEEVGFRLAWSALTGVEKSLLKELEKTQKIVAEDIKHIARELFQPANSSIVLIGPSNAKLKQSITNILKEYL